jgi:tRNA-dihydrouridine synthase B
VFLCGVEPQLIASPLQGFTEFRFRNAFHRYFGGIDTFYAPYIRLNGKLEIKPGYQRDLAPENNQVPELIPQVMTNDADEFLFVASYVRSLGYTELNWNLGCPYPMVTKRGMGSGLICNTPRIDEILQRVHNESDIVVSMKMRLGYDAPDEILSVWPILAKYPIRHISVHARLGKQLYKGGVNLDAFEACLKTAPHPVRYNGDITRVEHVRLLTKRFPEQTHWLIGRGLIADPFLPAMIKADSTEYPENRALIFRKFHDTLYESIAGSLSGSSHVLVKMESYWEYFSQSFPDPHKTFKRIKKAKSFGAYEEAVKENLSSLMQGF